MSKIRLGSKTRIVLEVNDKGETISFDFADPAFLNNAQQMTLEVQRIDTEFKQLGNFLEDGNVSDEDMLDDNMIALGTGLKQYYGELRASIDLFLGKNASQKIFGDDNYLTMFNDLFEALEPYLEKASKLQNQVINNAKQTALNKIPQGNKRSL